MASTAKPRGTRRALRDILLFGLCGGVLITFLKITEYRFLVVEHSVEIYGGLVAALFSALGIWLGLTLTRRKPPLPQPPPSVPFTLDETRVTELGITPPRTGDPRVDRRRTQQPGNRRPPLRQREYGQDSFEPTLRQTWRPPPHPGGPTRQTSPPDPLMGRPKVSFSVPSRKITRRYDDSFRRPPHNWTRATHKLKSEDLK